MQNNEFFINSVRFIGLMLLQVLVLNNINFLGYINPYLYIIFILLFPFSGNKSLLILLSFLLGLSIDFFSDSGGVHAAASVFLAYMRPLLLKFSFGVSYEYNSIKLSRVQFSERFIYVTLCIFLHHLLLFSLEVFSISHILLVIKSTLFSSIFSVFLVLSSLMLFSKKKQ